MTMSHLSILKYTEHDVKNILKKHGKIIEDVQHDVSIIREWMKTQPHLPEVAGNDVIERFLLINKFRIELTKQKLDTYYSVRSLIPEFYDKNPNSSMMHQIMDVVHFIPLPQLTENLQRVVVIKAVDTNVENFDVVSYIAHTFNVAEVRLRRDYYHKEIQIYDLAGLKIGHFAKFTPSIIKKGSFVVENVFANLSDGVHFINAPNYVDSFITLLKTSFNPKFASKIFTHKGVESLHALVSKDILPKDYGGNEKSLRELSDEWKKTFLDHDEVFQHLRAIKVNEKLREKPLLQRDDLFGVQGNFKQLNVD